MTDNKERDPLYLAAINCPHEIDHNRVVLHYDDKQPGHNALAQLGDRLAKAAQQVPPGFALVPIEPSKAAEEIARLRQELGYIANADTRDWDDPSPEQFKAWAQNRAKFALRAPAPLAPPPESPLTFQQAVKVWNAAMHFDTGEDGMEVADYEKARDKEIRAILRAHAAQPQPMADAKRLEWLMQRVCCDEIPGISIELGLSREQHFAEFRKQIDAEIERIDRAAQENK